TAPRTYFELPTRATGAAQVRVAERGMVLLASSELSRSLGESEPAVLAAIATGGLRVSTLGQEGSWRPSCQPPGLVFFAAGSKSPFSSEQVFTITRGAGTVMVVGTISGLTPGGQAHTYVGRVHVERDQFAGTVINPDPRQDIFFDRVLA